MRLLWVGAALLLTSCSRPYYALENGDLNVAVAKKRAGCGSKPGRACEMIDAFAEADEVVPLPKKRARYFGFLSASHKSKGVPVALIVERKNELMNALLLVWTNPSDGNDKAAKDFVKEGSDGGNYDTFFESPSRDPYPVKVLKGTKSIKISDIGTGTRVIESFLRKRGKRLFVVQMAGNETTEISAAGYTAPVWAGELRQLD